MLESLTMLNWQACHQLAGSILEAQEKSNAGNNRLDDVEVIANVLFRHRGQRWSYHLQEWQPIHLKIVFDDLS